MQLNITTAIGQKLMLAFAGKDQPSPEILAAIQRYRPAGFTLFRALNIDHPAQVRQLTAELQAAARQAGIPPLLIAVDQEGGQLMAIGEGASLLPGNLALGAIGSPELARQAGEVLGLELAAMGINVDYAPCCDVNVNPLNPVVGTRSFGEDPERVAELSAAMTVGLQSSRTAATAKHFPGHGDTASDSHHGIAVVPHPLERLRQVELAPFAASIRAGARLVMAGHLAIPAVDGRDDLPATLSAKILKDLLRAELGFDGVTITDALDMRAVQQGVGLGREAVRAAAAGADLLLLGANTADQSRVFDALLKAADEGQIGADEIRLSLSRIQALKDWLADQGPQPDLSVVGCAEHRSIASQIAQCSLTLVRDQAGLLPLRLGAGRRLAVILPRPVDLTPADTSSYVKPALAQALRRYHADVDEFTVPHDPRDSDIAALVQQLAGYDQVVVGTINASTQTGQSEMVRALLRTGIPTVVAALRMPYDLASFPEAPTYVCCYSILAPSMEALAQELFGNAEFPGRLPVSIPGLYPCGYSLKPS